MAAPCKRGQAFSLSESSIPALGDLVFFERNGKVYHVGLVKEYDPKTKQLITLEEMPMMQSGSVSEPHSTDLRTSPSRHVLSVAELVRYLRVQRGWTQAVLAKDRN